MAETTKQIDDGGSIMPQFHAVYDAKTGETTKAVDGGLTIRDTFAAHAMQALLTGGTVNDEQDVYPFAFSDRNRLTFNCRDHVKDLANMSYAVADAMLLARKPK